MKSTFATITSLYTQVAVFLGLCYMSREIAVVVKPIVMFHQYMNGYKFDLYAKTDEKGNWFIKSDTVY